MKQADTGIILGTSDRPTACLSSPLWVIQASILLILLLLWKVILSYFKSRFDSRKLANIGQNLRPNYTVNPVTAVTGRADGSPAGLAAPAHIDKLALFGMKAERRDVFCKGEHYDTLMHLIDVF